jgi:inner membrane protein
MLRPGRGTLRSAVLPVTAVVAVLVLDLVRAMDWPVGIMGLLDEPAHLLTAWLVLAAAAVRSPLRALALLAVVGIDLDHIPLFIWDGPTGAEGGRPVSHSLSTVVLLAVAATVPRWRTVATWLAAGVLLHFVRDIATSTGLPLLWPVRQENVLLPYWLYVVTLAALAAIATRRRLRSVPRSPLADRPLSAGPAAARRSTFSRRSS